MSETRPVGPHTAPRPTNLGYSGCLSVVEQPARPGLDGVRIAGLQFLPSEGGAAMLVPQAVVNTLAKLALKQRAGGPSLDRLTEAIRLLDEQIYVLAGVRLRAVTE
jgi:hypothetical protein